eukprot:750057_1
MATPGNANITTPGASTDGNTTQTAEPNIQNNKNDEIAKQNDNEYKLMDEDIDDGEEGYDMKNDDVDDEKKIDIDIANAKPFGGYKVAAKNNINGAFKKSEIIMEAMNKMERDINLGEFERKENEKLIDDHFNKLFNKLSSKKLELIQLLNEYYYNNKQESMSRINELKVEHNKEIEKEKDINYNEIEKELQSQQNEQQQN